MVNRFVKLTPKLCIMGKLLFECFVLAKPTKMKSVGPKNKCVSIFYIIFLFGISCQYTPKDTAIEYTFKDTVKVPSNIVDERSCELQVDSVFPEFSNLGKRVTRKPCLPNDYRCSSST